MWTQNGWCKNDGLKRDAMIDQIGPISHQLGSHLDEIELTVLCAFICKVKYFDPQS